jgi:hypothetical protein
MTIDFNEAWERSTEEHTFSNSTMWEIWSGNWCARCLREAPLRSGLKGNEGCALVAVAMLGRKPSEWLRQPDEEIYRNDGCDVANIFHCIEFRAPGGGGGGEPRPKPDPKGMDELFERPERQTRMYVQPQPAKVDA